MAFPPLSHQSSLLVLLQETRQDEQESEGDLEDNLLPLTEQPKKITANSLTPSQQEDLKQLLNEFPDVTGGKLGCTAVIKHEV